MESIISSTLFYVLSLLRKHYSTFVQHSNDNAKKKCQEQDIVSLFVCVCFLVTWVNGWMSRDDKVGRVVLTVRLTSHLFPGLGIWRGGPY